MATLEHIHTVLEFTWMVEEATLASQFDPEELAEFLNPPEHRSTLPDDPAFKLSLLNYLAFMGSSQETYNVAHQNTHTCYPNIKLLSYYQIEQRVQKLSGIITWEHHMCVNSCVGFIGPYTDLECCPKYGEGHIRKRIWWSLVVRGRFLKRSSQHFLLVHSFRLTGNTQRQLETCTIVGRRHENFGTNIPILMVDSLGSMMTYSVVNLIWSLLTKAWLTNTIPFSCYQSMACSFSETDSQIAGSTSGF